VLIWTLLAPCCVTVSGHPFQVSASGRLGRGFAAIAGPPTVDHLVIIAEDAITMRSCSRIGNGKQMLADSLCLFEIQAAADHPINNHWALVLEF
jgi:hypothetical protein